MLFKLKLNIIAIAAVVAFITLIVALPSNALFGKNYNNNQDFSCCKDKQLVIHHYYSTKLFGIEVNNGYDLEPVGKATENCNVKCAD